MSELKNVLLAKTAGKANGNNVVEGKKFRITVLTDGLVRLERGITTDLPSQTVWFRNTDPVDFETVTSGSQISIITKRASFVFNRKRGTFKYAVINGRKVRDDDLENMKGTKRTLDRSFGPVELDDGILSENGLTVMNDSKSLLLTEGGHLIPREKPSYDSYIFAYGNSHIECMKAFYTITGKAPLVPRFTLGNWWSRYRAYTQKEYEDLMDRFIEEDLPFTVATIDMDWHWVNVKEKFNYTKKQGMIWGNGWTGYSWNTDLFPDYKGFLKGLHERNMKVTMNLHPADGVRPFENMYKEMCDAVGQNPDEQNPVEFDMTDDTFINAYFDVLHHPYENDGVDFWWIDWQQGTRSKKAGLDPLWLLNHFHYLDNGRNGRRPLILSRYAGLGSHRYPLGFSGDTAMNWKVLNFQPYFTVNAANCGYTWWSHDIGGHHFGIHDDELYTRWLQFGVFAPILRLHSTSNDLFGKEPWNYNWAARTVSMVFLRLRHRLIPYIYSMNYRSYDEDRALCEPIYYSYPDISEAYSIKNEYMFGSELLVCPVTTPTDKKTKTAATKVWLPEGRWINIFTGDIYKGGRFTVIHSDIDSIPVFAKEGAVIPLSDDEGNGCGNPERMTFRVYTGNSSFTLYEDDGESNNYINGESSKTVFTTDFAVDRFSLSISDGKQIPSIPQKRTYTIVFEDIQSVEKADVYINGILESVKFDGNKLILSDISVEDRIEITLSGVIRKTNKPVEERVLDCFIRFNGANMKKSAKYKLAKSLSDRSIRRIRNKALRESVEEAVYGKE
ncbi:MAG: DUF5110 domain-containing protein [Clostridiales bacterium]|nr:DUF5110 domain-containing protein [Clostridiales bacterium]